jgi:hypothetical protein
MNNTKEKSADFMLAEYERIFALRNSEITQTEQRFNFFLTIVTASIGGIIFLSQLTNISQQIYFTALQGLLILLLLFGLLILNRQNVRSSQLHFYVTQLNKIQDYFGKSDSEIAAYFEWRRELMERSKPKRNLSYKTLGRLRGSLTDLIILIDSFLITGLVLVNLYANGNSYQTIITWTLITFISSIIILLVYHALMLRKLWLADG